MPVPFIDLRRGIAPRRAEYLAIVERVLDSGIYSLGPEVEQFEKSFAEYLGVRYAVAMNGGTLALYAALLALEIGHGDEVIVPANSFIATAEAVMMVGAKPVCADVYADSQLINLSFCESLVNEKTRAIIPVHLYGQSVEMLALMTWASERGLQVIEDTAQAHGAIFQDKKAGTWGTMGCFSFYPTKNLGSLGEGGAVVTNDDDLAERLRAIRCHGIRNGKYLHEIFGSNLKMPSLIGAWLALRLESLDETNRARREIARQYREELSFTPLVLPEDIGDRHVYHLFVVETDQRDALQTFLKERGIGTGIHYPIPIHQQSSLAKYHQDSAACPVTERLAGRILSLPMFPELQREEVTEVCEAIKKFYA